MPGMYCGKASLDMSRQQFVDFVAFYLSMGSSRSDEVNAKLLIHLTRQLEKQLHLSSRHV